MCLALPGEIIEILDEEDLLRPARVSFGGILKQVSLACLPEARVGDYVLVHVGFALSLLDPAEAEKVLDDLDLVRELESGGQP